MPITINGSGTISGISAGGLPDAIITQPELAANVAGNGPAFSAYMGSSQTVSNITTTKVIMNTELFDTNSNYDYITNYRFTPTVAGYYTIKGSASLASTTGTHSIIVYIFKNGSVYKAGCLSSATGAAFPSSEVVSLVFFNGTTDFAEIFVYIDVGSGTGLVFADSSGRSEFSGVLVRAA